MAEQQYKAFISYSHADEQWATWLHRSLERFRVPRRLVSEYELDSNRLLPIFRDRDELSTSSSLGAVIQSALAASDNLIVICSPAAAKSHWVNEEIKAFKALGRDTRIFCLIVDGADGECFPPALQDDEPLGADVRPAGDGKQNAKLKIVSGLLDIGFAQLKDRETRRRNQFFGIAAAASLAVAGIMTALAISAVIAGREAEKSRVLATAALEDAEAVAEFLAKMLTDLDPDAMGQTIIADIAEQAPDLALPTEVNGTNTARRLLDEHLLSGATGAVRTEFADRPAINARLERSIGDSYQAIGLYAKAMDLNSSAAQRYESAFGPLDERTLDARVRAALAQLYEGQLEASTAEFEEILAAVQGKFAPDHEVLLGAKNSLAMAYMDLRRTEEARDLLEDVTGPITAKFGAESKQALDARSNLAWALYLLEDYEAAEQLNTELLDIKRRVLGPQAYETLTTLNNLAMIYRRTGRYAEAESAHREEIRMSRQTLGDDHPEVLVSNLNLGRVLFESGQLDVAATHFRDAYDTAKRIMPPVHPLLAAVTVAYGDTKVAAGDNDRARELYLEASAMYDVMVEPGNPMRIGVDEKLAALEQAD